ncbi:type II toxin-antitoxin system RelE/ParE family toxin [Xenorhabdus bovienii]|uniref:type II toxin-antitoxin system RelE/ParE family toxin n=1 Tax=Xenorhabdus bovienii TaxID=40576 RepID=UPI0023B3403A|nr:type II toxin-antitoxin system RelE/ParE family toxin [Xenorhabdus bovienii]
MIFIETSIFTEDCKELLSDDEYREFQQYLADNPAAGDVIQHTGGLRKVRWASRGKGKRGGVRVIYYHKVDASHIYSSSLKMLDFSLTLAHVNNHENSSD